MKHFASLPVMALLLLAAPHVQAQTAGGDPAHQHQRFEQMDRKIGEAGKLHGKARHAKMMEHMQMMRAQMQSMHGMMGGMAVQRPGDSKKGPGQMGSGQMKPGQMGQMKPGQMGQMGTGGAQMMQNMQGRMDMMQKMMEQMHKQHELMLKDDG